MTWRRCHVTKNECGTDTWGRDYCCQCLQCQAWLAEQRILVLSNGEQQRRWTEAFEPTTEKK